MNELPFERGSYTCGAVDVGSRHWDPGRKQMLQVVKNTDAAALKAKRAAVWETPASYEVDVATAAADGPMVAGIVDPVLGTATVPVNAYCFVVVEGVVTAAIGSGTNIAAAGELLFVATTAIAANNGKLKAVSAVAGAVGLLTTELNELKQVIGVAHAAVSADSTNDVQIRITPRR